MRRLERRLMIAALGATPLLAGFGAIASLDLQPDSQLWVEGTSTVRDFKCTAGTMDATIATTGDAAATALYAGQKAVTTVAFSVPAAALDCRNGQMNEHMRKAIKADKAPTITFELGSYDLADKGGKMQAALTGTLSLGGVTKPITVTADLVKDTSGGVRVKGAYDLRMTEWGLKAPSLMMGAMKVNELVKVNFDLLLKD
jgi:polyisoprenoid-binding protein YceI